MAHGSKAKAQFGKSAAQMPAPQFMPVPPIQAKPSAQPAEMPEIELDPRNYHIDLANPLASMYGHSPAAPAPVQAKLTVGAVGDKYEQEADRVAAQVVNTINSPTSSEPAQREAMEDEEEEIQMKSETVQRETMEDEEEEIQMKSETVQRVGAEGGSVSDEFETQLQGAKGSGQALDAHLQAQMGQAMGADFSGVKVHTDAQSHQLNQSIQAKAFTTGQDLFFRQGEYDPGSRSGQELIAHELTHVVQQSGDKLQRHPSHAEEEEVQAKRRYIQRHPSHAEEEEVQARFLQDSSKTTYVGGGVIQRKSKKERRKREQELTQKFGVQIGGGKNPLPDGVLNKLEKVLSKIPKEHLTGTYLKNIGGEDGIGDASAYTQDGGTSGHIGIVVPSGVPDWLYPLLSKAVGWQRWIMDKGAISSLAPDVSKSNDKELGLKNANREVFAGVSDVLSKGNLLEWTILHEMGHAVDHKIKFTQTQAKKPEFGGWRTYDIPAKKEDIDFVADKFLKQVGIDYGAEKFPFKASQLPQNPFTTTLLNELGFVISGAKEGLTEHMKNVISQDKDSGFPQKWESAVTSVKIALSQPWMFADGGASKIGMDDGRIYHRDHYQTWISYLTSKRADALSNYQFSSPGEWFAESYAAFYDLKPQSPARNRLNNETKTWFVENLGLPPQRQALEPDAKPGLADESGELLDLQELERIAEEATRSELVDEVQD